ncbi:hypothetical protein [Corynebacterium doosanense]|uniref:Uncharacterized protein n=1 Tax=Corynebacterium doosanense CAU 212 = DSM 45436 TaxID=558173 RepID=A0A097IJT9_9CORY|nr:hypothetical protein [Corynebacterium doosanense]AIT62375.1 hypothetical protein CDOO_13370 [Corynebacterium doosanense CAU 212 = DSM 45436]
MLSPVTVRAVHKELGRPTDDATIATVREQFAEEVGSRIDLYATQLVNEWKAANPGGDGFIPGEVMGSSHGQALRRAEEEVMEEWFNGPIRTLMERKVARGIDGW